MSNTSPLNASTPRASARAQSAQQARAAAGQPSAPPAPKSTLDTQIKGLEDLIANGGKIPVTQNPSAPLPPTRLQKIRDALNKPVFTWKNEQVKKDDFFAGAKGLVNKIWTNKLAISASGAVGGGIATGVIFGIMYKAAIIGALGAFFSTHVGWAVAAGIGGALLVGLIVVLVRRAQHKDDIKDRNASAAHAGTKAERDNVMSAATGILEIAKELGERVNHLEGDARYTHARQEGLEAGRQEGYAQGHSAGYEQGHGEGRTHGMQQGISTARQADQAGDRPAAPGQSQSAGTSRAAGNGARAARAAARRQRDVERREGIDSDGESEASFQSSRTQQSERSSDGEGGVLPPEMMAQMRQQRSQGRQRSQRRS